MRIFKILIFGIILIIFQFLMFKISWEMGISSLVLISTILCIWLILKKITTIVMHKDLVLTSEPFRDSKKLDSNVIENDEEKITKTINTGLDVSIFEKFKNNLNLKSSNDSSIGKKFPPEIIDNTNLNEDPSFSEELDGVEKVRVTLSEKAKNKLEEQNQTFSNEHEEILNDKNFKKNKKLGTGEEALEILSSKHQALKDQKQNFLNSDLVEYNDDLFPDELIPIPGGDTLYEKENKIPTEKNSNNHEKESQKLEDEDNLENSLINFSTLNEKNSEAEALLKLSAKSCEAGRMEEAKESLKIYLNLLNDLNQTPSEDVKQLANKLEIFLSPELTNTKASEKLELKTETENNEDTIIQDLPEQANYASVMNGLAKSLEQKGAFEEALPLLNDLLNYNRKRINISQMDPLYDRIEQAYSSLKDDVKLVSTYKEHLLIKQQLDDLEGELNLLDLISYYYANTGDQRASEHYQAERQIIKDRLDKKIAAENETQ